MNQQQLRQANISSQVQAQARAILTKQVEQQDVKQVIKDSRYNDLQKAINVVSGKDKSTLTTQQEAYVNAMQWGTWTGSFTAEEKRILDDIHVTVQGARETEQGIREGTIKAPEPTKSDILKNLYAAQTGELTGIRETTKGTPKATTPTQTQEQPKGVLGLRQPTYDTTTGIYTSRTGLQQSMAQAPKGARLTGGVYDEFNKIGEKVSQQQNLIKSETKRYEDLGYSKNEANVLAKESASRGGVTLNPQESNIRLTQQRTGTSYNLSREIVRYKQLGYSEKDANKLARASLSAGGVTYTKEKASELTPTQRYVMGITGMSMEEAKKAETVTIKEYNQTTTVKPSNWFNVSNMFGFFNPNTKEIIIREVKNVPINEAKKINVSKWLQNYMQNITQSHEVAHRLDEEGKLNANFSFKNASGGKVDEEYYKEYYGKDYNKYIEGEYKAFAYENYISNPEGFTMKFPNEAKVFNEAIGYTPQHSGIFDVRYWKLGFAQIGESIGGVVSGVGDFVSLVKTTISGVKNISREAQELKSEVWKAGDAITQGELSKAKEGITTGMDYGTKKVEQTLWNTIFGGGMTGNVISTGNVVRTTTPTTTQNIPITPKETYISGFGGTGAYVSTSQTGLQGTVFARSPTIDEQELINKKIDTTKIIPTIVGGTLKVTENILNKVGTIRDIPLVTYSKESGKAPDTIGTTTRDLRSGLTNVGKFTGRQFEDIFNVAGIKTKEYREEKTIPLYQRTTLMNFGQVDVTSPTKITIPAGEQTTFLGTIPKVIGGLPEFTAWTVAPTFMAGTQVVSSSQQLKDIDKDTDKILEQQYKEYSKTKPEEGYELLSKEEFFKEYKTETKEQLKQQAIIEGGLALAFLGASAGSKVIRKVKDINQNRIFEATKKELENLESYKFKSVSLESPTKIEGVDVYGVSSIRSSDNLKQVIGGLGKTEQEINRGYTYSIVSGKVPYKSTFGFNKEVRLIGFDVLETGTKVLPKSVKQYGDITYSIVKGGAYPVGGTSAIYKKGTSFEEVINLLNKQGTRDTTRYLSFTESLSQPTKIEGITKIRTPEEIALNIKIPTKEVSYLTGLKTNQITKNILDTKLITDVSTKNILKNIIPIKKTTIKILPSLIESNYPTYVGGTSLFGGTSGFVSASTISEPTILTTPPSLSLSLTGNVVQEPRTRVDTSIREIQTTTQDLGLLTKTKTETKSSFLQPQVYIPKLKEEQLTKQTQTQQQVQLLKTEQLQKLKSKLLTKQTYKQRLKQKPTTKITPKIIPSFSFGGKKPTAKETLVEAFEVYTGKKGKEEKIGETLELFQAGKTLKKSLKETLKASGFVQEKKTGRRVSFGELADVLGGEFRAGKNDITRVVQRKEKTGLFGSRLGSQSERRLIQSSKGKKKGWF